MNEGALLSIAAVERDTGLSKDTLRVWERRYGFPSPARDALGERSYTPQQVAKLRLVKRLLEAGHRPGRIVPMALDALQQLSHDAGLHEPAPAVAHDLAPLLALMRRHDGRLLAAELRRLLALMGIGRFVLDIAAPLNVAIGDAWMRGQLEIFEEHIHTEALQVVLRQAIAALSDAAAEGPRVLLTTLPGEPHGLGLLMSEAMFALAGCRCQSLGVQTPLWSVVLAARACDSDIVALGFSGCMNPNAVHDSLVELRQKLPGQVALWAGGSAPVLHRRPVDGVQALASLQEIDAALRRWHDAAAERPTTATA